MFRYYARFSGGPQRRSVQHPRRHIQGPSVGAGFVHPFDGHVRSQVRDQMKQSHGLPMVPHVEPKHLGEQLNRRGPALVLAGCQQDDARQRVRACGEPPATCFRHHTALLGVMRDGIGVVGGPPHVIHG